MIVKEKFDLLKGVNNTLNLSTSILKNIEVENGPRKVFVVLDLTKNRISHHTKKGVFDLISDVNSIKKLKIVNLPSYSLPTSFNNPTQDKIVNLHPFGIDDILSNKPGPQNLYALMVYSIVFSDLVTGKFKLNVKFATPITNYFVSIFIRLFGKEYGLLGSFSSEINKLKFLTNLYILSSFFGIEGITALKRSAAASAFDYRKIQDKIKRYDFSNINDFILALSETGVMPNINRHIFTAKVLRQFGFNFLPALEDCSRFIATIATSEIKGSNVVSTYLYKYNERDFNQILEISKEIFRRK